MRHSVHFWERNRLIYNIPLIALSLFFWGREMLSGRFVDLLGGLVVLSFFAVLANLCYCLAYPIDLMLQMCVTPKYTMLLRWVSLLFGTLVASILAVCVLLG